MYGTWEKLDKREKASLIGIYAASLALVWTLGYGWGRSSSASSPMQTAGVSTQGSVEVIDLNQPPKPEAAPTESTAPTEPTPSAEVVVHVSGAVKKRGSIALRPTAESPTPSSRQAAQPNTPTSTRSTSPNPSKTGRKSMCRAGAKSARLPWRAFRPRERLAGRPKPLPPRRSSPSTSTPPPPSSWKPFLASVPCWRSGLSSTARRTAGSNPWTSCWKCAGLARSGWRTCARMWW
jgi:hypothetical protein